MKTKWVGLLFIRDKKVLMIRERDKDFFMLPGGRVEENENLEQALKREIKEELGVSIDKFDFYNSYDLLGKAESELINFSVYKGEVTTSSFELGEDIAEYKWVDSSDTKVGVVTSQKLFPELKSLDIID